MRTVMQKRLVGTLLTMLLVQGAFAGATTTSAASSSNIGSGQTTGIGFEEHTGGGGRNVVTIVNRVDSRLSVRGNIQLNRVPGPSAGPVNLAEGYSSCTDCQTLGVALQINLVSRAASRVVPQNAAVAVNMQCTRCVTVARALQYVYSVEDPLQVPPEAYQLIRAMDRELTAIQADRTIRLPEAEARINAVIARFSTLAESLNDQRDEDTRSIGPTPTPPVSATPGSNATPTPASSLGPAVTPTATASPSSASPTASPMVVILQTPAPSPSPTTGTSTLAAAPAPTPTSAPTALPTPLPTSAPIVAATAAPTSAPIAPPTTPVVPLTGTQTTVP
jgi:hypothetical protein